MAEALAAMSLLAWVPVYVLSLPLALALVLGVATVLIYLPEAAGRE